VDQTFNATSQKSGFVSGAGENRNFRQNNWSLYLGDNWRMTRKLTFSYGVRWEYYGPVDEKNGLVLLPVIPGGQTVQQTLLGNATVDFAGGRASVHCTTAARRNLRPTSGWRGIRLGMGRRRSRGI